MPRSFDLRQARFDRHSDDRFPPGTTGLEDYFSDGPICPRCEAPMNEEYDHNQCPECGHIQHTEDPLAEDIAREGW